MPHHGECEHCGARDDTTTERMHFGGVDREIELVLCKWCRQEFLAEDGITTPTSIA